MKQFTKRVYNCQHCNGRAIVGSFSVGCKRCSIFFQCVDARSLSYVIDNWNNYNMNKVKFSELKVGDVFILNHMKFKKIKPKLDNLPHRTDPTEVNARCLEYPNNNVDVAQTRTVIKKQ